MTVRRVQRLGMVLCQLRDLAASQPKQMSTTTEIGGPPRSA